MAVKLVAIQLSVDSKLVKESRLLHTVPSTDVNHPEQRQPKYLPFSDSDYPAVARASTLGYPLPLEKNPSARAVRQFFLLTAVSTARLELDVQ